MMINEVPTPGSREAQEQGCTCPVLDNGYGSEELGRIRGFWIAQNCPLHGIVEEEKEEGNEYED